MRPKIVSILAIAIALVVATTMLTPSQEESLVVAEEKNTVPQNPNLAYTIRGVFIQHFYDTVLPNRTYGHFVETVYNYGQYFSVVDGNVFGAAGKVVTTNKQVMFPTPHEYNKLAEMSVLINKLLSGAGDEEDKLRLASLVAGAEVEKADVVVKEDSITIKAKVKDYYEQNFGMNLDIYFEGVIQIVE